MKEGLIADRIGFKLALAVLLIYVLGNVNGFAVGYGKPVGIFIQIGGFIVIALLAWRLFIEIEHWVAGGFAEFLVSVALSQLPANDFAVEDDVILSRKGNIDHVVVGRTGVWTIETKYTGDQLEIRSGRIIKNGKWVGSKPTRQAWAEAKLVKDYLANAGNPVAKVNALLVYASREVDKTTPTVMIEGVVVTDYRNLVSMINRADMPSIIDSEKRKKIIGALRARHTKG